jgi:truncated hemoglobin YjbI
MENKNEIPTAYAYAVAVEKFEKLTDVFYGKVLKDEILQ